MKPGLPRRRYQHPPLGLRRDFRPLAVQCCALPTYSAAILMESSMSTPNQSQTGAGVVSLLSICREFITRFSWRMAITTRWCPAATRSNWRVAFRTPNSSSMRTPDMAAFSSATRHSLKRLWSSWRFETPISRLHVRIWTPPRLQTRRIWTPPRLQTRRCSGVKVRLHTYIRSLTTASTLGCWTLMGYSRTDPQSL
jgi:hypothetical protein